MRYRVVLIFPDNESLCRFILYLNVGGEVDSSGHTYVGTITDAQIGVARRQVHAYVRVARLLPD